jgi:hypothetical protein
MTKDELKYIVRDALEKAYECNDSNGYDNAFDIDLIIDAVCQPKEDCKLALEQKGHASEDSTLPKIDFDADMNRTYIPLPNNWEIQTKGNGSSFRIAKTDGSKLRYTVTDERIHPVLEDIAKSCHAEILKLEQQRGKLLDALEHWDAAINYQYCGSQEAMSYLQKCAFDTKYLLDKFKGENNG